MHRKAIVVILLALLILFSSCGGAGGSVESSEVSSSAEAPQGLVLEDGDCRVDLYAGGKTLYKLIRPEYASKALTEQFTAIARVMKDAGISFYDGADDWLQDPTAADGLCEVLLGNTARKESKAALDALGPDGYAVAVVNNKVVIAAHTPGKFAEAVNVFCNELLKFETKDGGVCAYLSGTRVSRGEETLAVAGHGGLSAYRIVYPEGSDLTQKTAADLQDALKKVCGADLPLVPDSTPKSGPEIVVGNADRDICRKFAAELPPDRNIKAEDGGDIVILGSTDYATQAAVSQFIAEFLSRGYSDTLAIGEGAKMTGINYIFENDTAKAAGADVRIMSFNILAELWNSKPPIAGRDDALMVVLRAFQPDVIGLQEVSDGWYAALDARFGDEFAIVDRKNNAGNTNFSPLAYNKNTVKVLEHGVKEYSQGNDLKLRLVSWGYFEVLATGRRFVSVTTHWDLGSNPQYLTLHCREMARIVKGLEEKYNCAVITTGDYNTRENTEYYKTFVENSGYKEAKYTAAVIEKACKTTHTLGSGFANTPGNSIDHIFGSEQAEFLYFNVILDQVAIDVSDHCPIYADVKLK